MRGSNAKALTVLVITAIATFLAVIRFGGESGFLAGLISLLPFDEVLKDAMGLTIDFVAEGEGGMTITKILSAIFKVLIEVFMTPLISSLVGGLILKDGEAYDISLYSLATKSKGIIAGIWAILIANAIVRLHVTVQLLQNPTGAGSSMLILLIFVLMVLLTGKFRYGVMAQKMTKKILTSFLLILVINGAILAFSTFTLIN